MPEPAAQPERIPASEWTDDEWLEVLTRFPPKANSRDAERWVADHRRQKTADNA